MLYIESIITTEQLSQRMTKGVHVSIKGADFSTQRMKATDDSVAKLQELIGS